MAPKRLSDDEKKEIVDLYRQPEETTSTLAARYGVSSSTISRILKQNLSADEYDALVQQKRTGSGKPSIVDTTLDLPGIGKVGKAAASSAHQPEAQPETQPESASESAVVEPEKAESPKADSWTKPKLRGDRPSAAVGQSSRAAESPDHSQDGDEPDEESESSPPRRKRRVSAADADVNGHQPTPEKSKDEKKAPAVGAKFDRNGDDESDENDEAFSYSSYEDDDHEDDDDLDDDFSDDLDDEDDEDDEDDIPAPIQNRDLVKVFPFADVELPRTCYLVIDRFAELIAPPMKDFAELGKIPDEEMSAKTLPIFDNHRVAKRFANRRTQRIVKVPDGRMLQKTMPYLSAKGITRLLLDGQVYALIDSE